MSVANTAVKALYQGNGSNDTFAIPFQYIPTEASTVVKVYSVDDEGVKTLLTEGAMQDYVLDPPYDANTNPTGPANVIFNTPPTADEKVLVIRYMLLRQVLAFSNIGRIPGESVEQGLDRLCYLIQQLNDKLGRTAEFNILDDGVVNFEVPKIAPDTYIGFNDTGTGFVLKTAAEIFASIPGGGSLPIGGDIGDFLEKLSPTPGDAAWMSANYEGISRFGPWSSAGLKDTIDKIIAITYTPPNVSLSGSSNVLREKGDSVSNITLTAAITKQSDPIDEVRFYRNPSTLLDTQNAGGGIPNGGNSTYMYATPFTDNVTFRVEVDDNGDTGGPTTVQSTTTYSFVYPYFDGANASAALTAAQVATLNKRIINTAASIVRSFTANASDTLYFAQPSSYPALTQILDVNNFDVTASWSVSTGNYTALDGSSRTLRVYKLNNPVAAGSYTFTFRR